MKYVKEFRTVEDSKEPKKELPKEEKERRMKELSRDEDTLKENIEIVKELLETEEEEGDILMLNSISSHLTDGKLEGKEACRVTINFGEVSYWVM
jgi:hypothetical protein